MQESARKKQEEEEKIRKLRYLVAFYSYSNMRHSSNKKNSPQIKSKYLDYRKFSLKSPGDTTSQGDLSYNPLSRKQMDKGNTMTFIPQINKSSQMIKREVDISEHLYRDASARKESQSKREALAQSPTRDPVQLPKKSPQYLWKKLKSEFSSVVNSLNLSNPLYKTDLKNIMTQMKFLTGKTEKKIVKGKEYDVEEQLVRKVMHSIRLSRTIAKEVYNEEEQSITDLAMVRKLMYFLCTHHLLQNISKDKNTTISKLNTNSSILMMGARRLSAPDTSESNPENTGNLIQNEESKEASNHQPQNLPSTKKLLSEHQMHKLRNVAVILNDNRRKILHKIKNQEKEAKANRRGNFSPNLSPRTKELGAMVKRKKSPKGEKLHDWLLRNGKEVNQRIDSIREDKLDHELDP